MLSFVNLVNRPVHAQWNKRMKCLLLPESNRSVYPPQKKAPTLRVGAVNSLGARCSVSVEDPKPAAREHGRDIATTEAQVCIRGKHGVLEQVRIVIVGVNRGWRKIIGKYRIIGREGRGYHLIDADPCAGQRAVDAVNETGAVSSIRAVKYPSLLHVTAKLSPTDDFKHVAHAAPKFLFRIGAARKQSSAYQGNGKKG